MTEPTVYDPLGAHHAEDPATEWGQAVPSTLDDLRFAVEAAEQVAEVEFSDCTLYGPGGYIRLTCSTEISQQEYKKIQLGGLPAEQRKKRIPDLRKMDEALAMAKLIVRQTYRIELLGKDGQSYRPVESSEPRPLEDPTVCTQLGVLDPVMAARRIFGNKDPYLIRAGEELVNACGYGDRKPGEPGDDEDPT